MGVTLSSSTTGIRGVVSTALNDATAFPPVCFTNRSMLACLKHAGLLLTEQIFFGNSTEAFPEIQPDSV